MSVSRSKHSESRRSNGEAISCGGERFDGRGVVIAHCAAAAKRHGLAPGKGSHGHGRIRSDLE